ncbi:plasmid pRiA4b ORF-3 family protein [Filibacter tadaridae]|uniref:Plasmid pRiA4b ORF-3-like protein n=1 Tax=Filibacter tadaridae TaxID=2483811 RepID=A0A3P5X0R3_9BACL|nr:plasmid pRiA4b ORF-3 family protein [Filibacter tadaridae]VDC24811.1 Plasmid pRiA4b ORF-3-like protein [Filibacter tadaridae]
MIYQFKILLKQSSPPIWRRLLVDSKATFQQLHEIIQAAFDWDDSHLHSFSVRKTGGRKVADLYIGPKNMIDGPPSFRTVDENTELLSGWFKNEKDFAVYTYDFGVNWQHEITFEKVLQEVPGERYPQCVKATQSASGDEDWKKATLRVNEALAPLSTIVAGEGEGEGSDSFDWEAFFNQAKAFNALKPWETLDDNQIFVVIDPESRENLFCSILGGAGEEFGMAVYIGEAGLRSLEDTFDNTKETMDLIFKQRSILLSFVDRDELDTEDYKFIKKHGGTFRGRKQWLQFRSFVPGSYPWLIDEEEARILSVAIERAMEMCKQVRTGVTRVPVWEGDLEFPAQIPSSEEESLLWKDGVLKIRRDGKRVEKPELFISELDLKRAQKLERQNSSIEFEIFHLDTPVQEKKDERPQFPMMAVVLDHKNGLVLFQEIYQGTNEAENAQHAFISFVQQTGFRPREIWLSEDSYRHLSLIIRPLRMEVMRTKALPNIKQLKEFLREMRQKDRGF